LRREELPNEFAVALTAVRTQPNVTKPFYAIGGRRLDKNFLASLVAPAGMRALLYLNLDQAFVPADITSVTDEVKQPERFCGNSWGSCKSSRLHWWKRSNGTLMRRRRKCFTCSR